MTRLDQLQRGSDDARFEAKHSLTRLFAKVTTEGIEFRGSLLDPKDIEALAAWLRNLLAEV